MGEQMNINDLQRDAKPVFLISAPDEAAGRLEAHTLAALTPKGGIRKELRDISARHGAPVRHRAHADAALERTESLEGLLRHLKCGTIIHDPTEVFGRSKCLVAFANALRAAEGTAVHGVYWCGDWRTVFVVLSAASFVRGEKINIDRLAVTEKSIKATFFDACGEAGLGYVEAVRVTFAAPPVAVTPVDCRSEKPGSKIVRKVSKRLGVSVLGAALGLGGAAQAEESKPAVSDVNGSLSIMGGAFNANSQQTAVPGSVVNVGDTEQGLVAVVGSITVPLGHEFGAQVDAAGGFTRGNPIYGAGLHVFWRDPDIGLAGLTAAYAGTEQEVPFFNGVSVVTRDTQRNIGRVGLEGELYLGQFSILAHGGYQFGDGEDDVYARLNLGYYPLDDVMLRLGAEYMPGVGMAGEAGIEYSQPFTDSIAMSFYADVSVHSHDNYRALGGIRFYFGSDKSLIRRHREDDPRPDGFIAGLANGAQLESYFGGATSGTSSSAPPPDPYIGYGRF
ncbi:MAG: hypothetical protein AAF666_13330 [Pseudomonadota bacterium]